LICINATARLRPYYLRMSPTRFPHVAPLIVFAAFGAPPGSAQELAALRPVLLERMDVNAARPASLTAEGIAAARDSLRLAAGGVETVDSHRYLRGRASTLADTFALSPGVFAQPRFGSDEARLSIRGSGLQRTFHGRGLRVLQDGVPLNSADGGFDMQAIEPTAADHIAIWRGANALAYGSSTLGGAIDYVTRTGRDAPGSWTRVEAGSFGYLRATLTAGAYRPNSDAFASFTHQQQRGFRDHAEQNNQRIFANVGVRHSRAVETRVSLAAVRTDSELPGSLTKAGLAATPTSASPSNLALDQKRDFDLVRLASKTTFRAGDTTWHATAAWTYKDLSHPIFQYVEQLSNDALAGLSVSHHCRLFGREHRLNAGVLYTRGVTHAAQFVNNAGEARALLQKNDQTAANVETYAESQFAVADRLTVIAGVSAAHNRRTLDRIFSGPASYDARFRRVSPKLGLRWDGPGAQVFANLADSYEPPSFSETVTANAARHAQTARTLEVGTRGARGSFRWDFSVYRGAVKNELLAIDHDNNPATSDVTINAPRTTHTGFELGIEGNLLARGAGHRKPDTRLMGRLAWTYGAFSFRDDPVFGRNTLAGLPPHLLRGELMVETASGWYAGPTFEWVPRPAYIDHRNTFSADAYALAGFKLGRRQDRGLSGFVEVRNLTDRRYAATTGVIADAAGADTRQFLPGDGRSLYIGFEYAF
jgi:iron complex outermembrane recepter protein